jgi:hypothetical protein
MYPALTMSIICSLVALSQRGEIPLLELARDVLIVSLTAFSLRLLLGWCSNGIRTREKAHFEAQVIIRSGDSDEVAG